MLYIYVQKGHSSVELYTLKNVNISLSLTAVTLSLDSALFGGSSSACQAQQPPVVHHRPKHSAPQGCVLSPFLYSLFTDDCVSSHASVQLLEFADDTRIRESPRTDRKLSVWCGNNNSELNASKTNR